MMAPVNTSPATKPVMPPYAGSNSDARPVPPVLFGENRRCSGPQRPDGESHDNADRDLKEFLQQRLCECCALSKEGSCFNPQFHGEHDLMQ
jgi:hypothetical protein